MRPAEGVKIFRREIPGAIPLSGISTKTSTKIGCPFSKRKACWASRCRMSNGRLSPAPGLAGGQFLVRMASSSREETRKFVARALRAVGSSTILTFSNDGLEVVAALPAAEAAELIDVVENWLTPESAAGSRRRTR